jgi:hypothetical protein
MNSFCPTFYDSSKQILLHFLRDLQEHYKIKNVAEPLKLPLAMRAVTDPIVKNGSVLCTVSKMVMNILKPFLQISMEFAHPIQDQMRHLSG